MFSSQKGLQNIYFNKCEVEKKLHSQCKCIKNVNTYTQNNKNNNSNAFIQIHTLTYVSIIHVN